MAALPAGWISPVHCRGGLPRWANLNSERRSGDQTRHTTVIAGIRDQPQAAERRTPSGARSVIPVTPEPQHSDDGAAAREALTPAKGARFERDRTMTASSNGKP